MKDRLDFDGLALIAGGHSAFQMLWAGVQLNVFGVLSEQPGLTKKELSERIGLEPQPTRILLTGLTALRLVEKVGNGYANSPIVEELLVPSSPNNLAAVLGWQALIVYPGEMDFVESLRCNTNIGLRQFPGEENNLYQRLAHDEMLEKVFHDAMSALSHSANRMLCSSIDFSDVNHVVDAGGGDGTNAIALARAHPHLRITVFDAPSVCELASRNFIEAGLSDRLSVHPGDLFSTPFPSDMDCALFAHMMTIWSLEDDTLLLARAHDALQLGGRAIVFNMMAHDDEDGPISAALGSPYFLTIATGRGMLYSWGEYEACLARAGFRDIERRILPRDHGILSGVK